MRKPEFYVIDIGTNSARLMSAVRENGAVRSLGKEVVTVRTGENMQNGRLADAAMQRVCDALSRFKGEAAEGIPIYAFATSAVREAENGGELVKEIMRKTGIAVDVISGEQEALASFTGACGSGGMIDLGGGSAECAAGENGELYYRKSFPMGIVRAKNMFSKLTDADAAGAVYDMSMRIFEPIPREVRGLEYTAVGGTATSAAAMLLSMEKYNPDEIQGYKVTRSDTERLLAELKLMETEERRHIVGLPPARADVIVYGLAILNAMLDTLGADYYLASDRDNLEGYAELMGL